MGYAFGGDDTTAGEKPPGKALWVAAVWWPTAVVLLELTTRMCADTFFDPLPSFLHVLLVCAVPVLNGVVLRHLGASQTHTSTPWLNAMAFGISTLYALIFLPLAPIGLFALAFFGLGLLPLTPFIALMAAWRIRVRVRRRFPSTRSAFALGALLPTVLIVAVDAQRLATVVALSKASHGDSEDRTRAIRWLRRFGSEGELLLQSNDKSNPRVNPLAFAAAIAFEPASTAEARTVYYRTTGRPFNSAPLPRSRGPFEFWDRDQGGDQVGGPQTGLSLAQSTIDGSLDPEGSLGYVEWVMQFANESNVAQEARAQIQLPEGGVVSRATLWVHGAEQEAVIASRAAARQAYESVVRQSRDPLLITTVGAQRILVQCFPVPSGGRMKIRVGVTFPLELKDRANSVARLPYFVEKNFVVDPAVRHAVWIESEGRLRSRHPALSTETASASSVLRGLLADEDLAASGREGREIELAHDPVASSWASDVRSESSTRKTPAQAAGAKTINRVVVQRIEERQTFRPGKIVIVLDTSASMKDAGVQLASALSSVPPGIEVLVVPASDDPNPSSPASFTNGASTSVALANDLRAIRFEGGIDNSRALLAAWDLASSDPFGVVLWIHGPQPISSMHEQALNQRFERSPGGPRVWLYAAAPGPNRLMESLSPRASIRWIPPSDHLEAGLRGLFASLGVAPELIRHREMADATRARIPTTARKTSGHLARLWANDTILRGLQQGERKEDLVALAVRYRLVTPVSGAVVLETAADYKAAGLEVRPPNEIPTVPEPEVWALMVIVLAVIAWRVRGPRGRVEANA